MMKACRLLILISLLCPFSVVLAAEPAGQTQGVEQHLQDLKSPEAEVRLAAAEALQTLGPAAAQAVPALTQALQDTEADIRAAAAVALAKIGPAGRVALPELLPLLSDDAFTRGGHGVWVYAAISLGHMAPEAVPPLVDALGATDAAMRRAAAIGLSVSGEHGRPAVPALITMLGDEDPNQRNAAVEALMGIGPAAEAAVPALIELLAHENFHTQYWSCRALGRIGAPAATPAVPVLRELVSNGVASVRGNAAVALGNIGPASGPEVVPVLVAALADGTHSVRRSSAQAVAKLGPFAKAAAPALETMAADPECTERVEVALALWRVTSSAETTLEVLLEALQNINTSLPAAQAIGQLGDEAQPAVPELRKLLAAEKTETRLLAALACGGIGPAARAAIPDLKQMLDDDDESLRETARQAIERIAAEGPSTANKPPAP